MRITQQVLRAKACAPLQAVEYLDLSNLAIVTIEKLTACPKLQALNLRGNSIAEVSNLEQNRHLWRLDFSNNEIKDLDCLSRFIALGSLNLANNDISWHEVGKLRHMHVLELSLHGNKQLEKDPYYRIHVIDCLPNVWMLDGRMITSAERLQVKHFFADSAMSEHPIRRKLAKEWFVPSNLKRIEVNGIYGDKATHLMTRFPANGPSNIDVDRRRLKYLAHNAQEDLMIEKKYTKRELSVLKYRKTFIEDILDARPGDRERCNMLLLMLVATLEFVMPTHLVKETLEVAKLSKIGKVYTMDLFLLPKDIRCRIVCILLGAVKVDKDSKEDGGLYDKLYLCLFYTVAELAKLSNSIFGKNNAPKLKRHKCVMNMLVTATGDIMITEKITKLTINIHQAGGDTKKLYEELSDFLLQMVQEQSLNLSNKSHRLSEEDQVIKSTKSIPMKSTRSPLDAADFHMKGITSPNLDPPTVLSARRQAEKNRKYFPHLGDYLLLGPQTLGKVIGLPQPFVAHVAMDSIPVANGAMESKLRESEDHYTYVNMDQFDYDVELSFWKPRGSIGDNMLQEFLAYSNGVSRFTIHTIEDLRKELNRRANLVGDQAPRPNSPEESMRAYSTTPGRECSTPLIFSSGGLQASHEHLVQRSGSFAQAEYSPRPMTSLLKEKLDLKLDFNARRIQSAGPIRTVHSPTQPSPTQTHEDIKPQESVRQESVPVSSEHENSPECVHCAIAASSLPQTDTQQQQQQQQDAGDCTVQHNGETDNTKTEGDTTQQPHDTSQQQQSESNKENEQPKPANTAPPVVSVPPPDTGRTDIDSLALSDDEPELQNLGTTRSQRPASAPGAKVTTPSVMLQEDLTKRSSSLKINIPQMELLQDNEDDSSARKGRAPIVKGRQLPFTSQRSPMKTGLSLQGKNRPYSAMDAYRYIVEHPRKPIGSWDNFYNTSYQQQRTEAWRLSAANTASNPHTPRQGTPPPQRPTSPDPKPRPGSGLSVKKANDWLAGGRDLYWESLQKRPRSGHVPGWKDGLPDSMKRPRSAVAARTLNRQSKRSHPVTPSSLAYEAMMQGTRTGSPRWSQDSHGSQIPDMLDLTDYQPLYHQLGLPRRLGSAGSNEQSAQDTVYRKTASSSSRNERSPKSPSSIGTHGPAVNMKSIYEDEESTTYTTENPTPNLDSYDADLLTQVMKQS